MGMVNPLKQFDVCLVTLDPTIGAEIRKTRPCLVISPDSMNLSRLKTIIVAPMTSKIREYLPTRINLIFQRKKGQVALDQLRAIDRGRIISILGNINQKERTEVSRILQIMFS
jgi:mRNA interferase MazF